MRRLKGKREESFEQLLAEERLILEATELVEEMLEARGVNRTELARRLGKSKGHVSQLLSGERNLTLRTIAEIAHALSCRVRMLAEPAEVGAPPTPANLTGPSRPSTSSELAEYRRQACYLALAQVQEHWHLPRQHWFSQRSGMDASTTISVPEDDNFARYRDKVLCGR